MTDQDFWSSDVAVSMPLPSKFPVLVPMSGFAFTAGGLAHDITEVDYKRLSTPDFSPDEMLPTIYGDEDLDAPFTSTEVF